MNQFPSEVHRVVNLGTFTTTYGHAAAQTQKWMTYSRSQNMAIVTRFGGIGKISAAVPWSTSGQASGNGRR